MSTRVMEAPGPGGSCAAVPHTRRRTAKLSLQVVVTGTLGRLNQRPAQHLILDI